MSEKSLPKADFWSKKQKYMSSDGSIIAGFPSKVHPYPDWNYSSTHGNHESHLVKAAEVDVKYFELDFNKLSLSLIPLTKNGIVFNDNLLINALILV